VKPYKNQNVAEILNEIYREEISELDEELNIMRSRSIPKEEW